MQAFMQREYPMPHAVLYESRDGAVVLATEADYAAMLAAHAAAGGLPTLRLAVEPLGPAAAPPVRTRPPVAALHIAVPPAAAVVQPRVPPQSQYETRGSVGGDVPGRLFMVALTAPPSPRTLHQALARRRRRAGRGGRPRH